MSMFANGELRSRDSLAGRMGALADRMADSAIEARLLLQETEDPRAIALAGMAWVAAGRAFNLRAAIESRQVRPIGQVWAGKPRVEPAPPTPDPRPVARVWEVKWNRDDPGRFAGYRAFAVRVGPGDRPRMDGVRLVVLAHGWEGIPAAIREHFAGTTAEYYARPEDLPVQFEGHPAVFDPFALMGLPTVVLPGKEAETSEDGQDEDEEGEARDPAFLEGEWKAEEMDPAPLEQDEGPAVDHGMIGHCAACNTPIRHGDAYATDALEQLACSKCGLLLAKVGAGPESAPPAPEEPRKKSNRSWDILGPVKKGKEHHWLARVYVPEQEEAQRFADLAHGRLGDVRLIQKASARYSMELIHAGDPKIVKVGGGLYKVATLLSIDDEDPATDVVDSIAPADPSEPAPIDVGPDPADMLGWDAERKLEPYDVIFRPSKPGSVTFLGRIMAENFQEARSTFGMVVGFEPDDKRGSLFATVAWPVSQYDRIVGELGGMHPIYDADRVAVGQVCLAPACKQLFGVDCDWWKPEGQPEAVRAATEAAIGAAFPDEEEEDQADKPHEWDVYFTSPPAGPKFVGRIRCVGDDEDAEIGFQDAIRWNSFGPGLWAAIPADSEHDGLVMATGGIQDLTIDLNTGPRTYQVCISPDGHQIFGILDGGKVEEPESDPPAPEPTATLDPDPVANPELAAEVGEDDVQGEDPEAFDVLLRRDGREPLWLARIESESAEQATFDLLELLDLKLIDGVDLVAVETTEQNDALVRFAGGFVSHKPDHLAIPVLASIHPAARSILAPPPAPSDPLGIRVGDHIKPSFSEQVFRVEARAKVDQTYCAVHGKMCKAGRDVWNLVATQVHPAPKPEAGKKAGPRRFEGYFRDDAGTVRHLMGPCEKDPAAAVGTVTLEVVDKPGADPTPTPSPAAPIKAGMPSRDFDVTFFPKAGTEKFLARVEAQTPQGARTIIAEILEPPADAPQLRACPAERKNDAQVAKLGGMVPFLVDAGKPTEHSLRIRIDLELAEKHGILVHDDEPEPEEDDPAAPPLPEFHGWWDVFMQAGVGGMRMWVGRFPAVVATKAIQLAEKFLGPAPARMPYFVQERTQGWDDEVAAAGGIVDRELGEETIPCAVRARTPEPVKIDETPSEASAEPPAVPALEKGYCWWDVSLPPDLSEGSADGWLARLPASSALSARGRACEAIQSAPVGMEFHAEPANGLLDPFVAEAGGIRVHDDRPGFPFARRADAEARIKAAYDRIKERARAESAQASTPPAPSKLKPSDAFMTRRDDLYWTDVFLMHVTDTPATMQWVARVEARNGREAISWAEETIGELPAGYSFFETLAMPMHDNDVIKGGGFSGNPYRSTRFDLAKVMQAAAERSARLGGQAQSPEPAPHSPGTAPEPSAEAIDSVIEQAIHWADGAARRWAMRKASGQSGRDLKAAILYELTKEEPPADAPYSIGGLGIDRYLKVDANGGEFPTRGIVVDMTRLAIRVRGMLEIPVRQDAEEVPKQAWAITAKKTGVVFYAVDAEDFADAEPLLEPSDRTDPLVSCSRVPRSKIKAVHEVRRLPRPEPAAGPSATASDVQTPKPAPAVTSTKEIDKALSGMFMRLSGEVLSRIGEPTNDEDLAAAIASDLEPAGRFEKPGPIWWRAHPKPGVWVGSADPEGRPTLAGQELVKRARQVLEIPFADGTLPPAKRLGRKPRETAATGGES